MTAIHEVQQILWVETELGEGQVLFLMDYGIHENTIYIVALQETREIKHFTSEQIRICKNHTLEMDK